MYSCQIASILAHHLRTAPGTAARLLQRLEGGAAAHPAAAATSAPAVDDAARQRSRAHLEKALVANAKLRLAPHQAAAATQVCALCQQETTADMASMLHSRLAAEKPSEHWLQMCRKAPLFAPRHGLKTPHIQCPGLPRAPPAQYDLLQQAAGLADGVPVMHAVPDSRHSRQTPLAVAAAAAACTAPGWLQRPGQLLQLRPPPCCRMLPHMQQRPRLLRQSPPVTLPMALRQHRSPSSRGS